MHILISGANVAGLTLAWFLVRTSTEMRVTVTDKNEALHSHKQNIILSSTAFKILKKMGLVDRLRPLETKEIGTRFVDPLGRPFAPYPVKMIICNSPAAEFEVLGGDLVSILYEAVKDLPNVNFLFGTTIKGLLHCDDDTVEVRSSRQSLGNEEEIHRPDLLVAADGQCSEVRDQCFPIDSIQTVDLDMYMAYWTIPRVPSDNDRWNIHHAFRSRVVTLRPGPNNTIRAMVTCMPCNDNDRRAWQETCDSDRQTQEDFLRQKFSDVKWETQRTLNAMHESPDFHFHAVQQLKMSKWSDKRVICLGDTAYAPSALTGMSTSLSIIGAYTLAGELSKFIHGRTKDLFDTLEAYESILRPFVEEVQAIPPFFPSIFHPETRWQKFLLRSLLFSLSGIVAIPGVAWMLEDAGDDDFLLPRYSSFEVDDNLK